MLAFLLSTALLWSGCVREKAFFTYEITDLEFVSDDMVFEGSNTLQQTHTLKLAAAAGLEQLTEDQIKKVKLTKAILTTDDSLHFDILNSIVLQLSSDNTEMTQLAVVNPIPEGLDQLNMTIAAESDVADAFKQNTIYLIADADVKNDSNTPIRFKASLTFEVTIKK
jgi:hypothetical protein